MLSRAATLVAALTLAACGQRADLEPAAGHALPVKPLMAHSTPSPDDLLTPPTYANPDRVDELIKKSAPRMSDRFDLPPPNGAAPTIPVEADDSNDEQSTEEGPVSPQ